MTQIFNIHKKLWSIVSSESYAILMRIGNQKTTIDNKVGTIEQMYDPSC